MLIGARAWRQIHSAGTVYSLEQAPQSEDFSFPRYVEDLDAVRTFFGADKIHLLAHSWGAAVSMAYAVARPDRVGSLVLVGGAPPDVRWSQRRLGSLRGAPPRASKTGKDP